MEEDLLLAVNFYNEIFMNNQEQQTTEPTKSTQWTSLAILFINVAVYLVLLIRGVNWLNPEAKELLRWGANFAPFTLTGETWRLFSSMFLHAGILHLVANMYMLIVLGSFTERRYGSVRFAVLYLLSGLGGGVLSALWFGYHKVNTASLMMGSFVQVHELSPAVSVGASGAIMGLAGASFVARLVGERNYDASGKDSEFKAIVQVIILNLAIGFMAKGIDQAAHIGGLLTGVLTGFLLIGNRQAVQSKFKQWGYPFLLACLGTFASLGIASHAQSDELIEFRQQLRAEQAESDKAIEAENRKLEAAKLKELEDAAHEAELKALPPPVEENIARGTVVKVGQGPDDMALSPDGKRLYVTNGLDNSVSVLDLERKALDRTINKGNTVTGYDRCPPPENVCGGQGAAGIAISSDERYAYVTALQKDALSVIDLTNNQILRTIKLGRAPRDVRLSANGDIGYVINAADDSVSFVDLVKGVAIGDALRMPGYGTGFYSSSNPLLLLLSNDNNRLYVKTNETSNIVVFDTEQRKEINSIELPGHLMTAVEPQQGQPLWLSSNNAIVRVDPNSLETQQKVHRGYSICKREMYPVASTMNANGSLFAFASSDKKQVYVVKVATGRTIGIYPTGQNPRRLAFSRDGKYIYVLNADDQSISILDRSKSLDVKALVQETGEILCPLEE